MDMNSYAPLQRIFLFGPTQSGKDWLIRGFAKEVEQTNLNDRLSFYYRLQEVIDEEVLIAAEVFPPINIPGTLRPNDIRYVFTREPKDKKNEEYRFSHYIVVYNNKGDNLINALLDPDNNLHDFNLLESARNFIVVVGPPENELLNYQPKSINIPEENFPQDPFAVIQEQERSKFDPQPEYDVTRFTVSKYERVIRELLNRLRNKQPKRNVAICMTKADQDGLLWRDPNRYFFSTFPNLKSEIESFKSAGHNLKIFRSSAAGMLQRMDSLGRRVEEANFEVGELKDPEKWKPQGNAQPFYWIFQTIEKEAIKESQKGFKGFLRGLIKNNEDYPPYPGLRQDD